MFAAYNSQKESCNFSLLTPRFQCHTCCCCGIKQPKVSQAEILTFEVSAHYVTTIFKLSLCHQFYV